MDIQLIEAGSARDVDRIKGWAFLWGCGLSDSALLIREHRLSRHTWGIANRRVVSLGNSHFSTCEVYRCGGIFIVATLFTPEAHRGYGHASSLLRVLEVTVAEAPWSLMYGESNEVDAHNGFCGVLLFSEIGPDMYRKLGYCSLQIDTPHDVLLPALGNVDTDPSVILVPTGDLERLDRDIEGALCALHEQDVRWLAARSSSSCECERYRLPLCASRVDWHAEVERHRAEVDGVPQARHLLYRGASAAADAKAAEAAPGVIAWAADWPESELVVLILLATSPRQTSSLIRAAQCQAAAAGLRTVRVWEPIDESSYDSAIRAALQLVPGALREPRKGKLPMSKMSPINRQGSCKDGCAMRVAGLHRVHWW